jgi:hypothetical protein
MREILENPPELEYVDGMSGRETQGNSGTLK